jgi:DNA integrity scanning protein DisA with diadenylate cyclase activity
MNKQIEETILETCIKIGKRGEGAIILVGDAKCSPLVNQSVTPFKITNNPKLLESLALMDGAVIVSEDGMLKSYGVKLETGNVIMRNFGTRHSAALSASMIKGNTVFVVSEEDRKVRILKEGKIILEIDSLTKNVEQKIPEISKIMESVGYGTLGVLGMSVLTFLELLFLL